MIAGIDAIKKLNIIDENKIAVSGWSYGGYMTSWLIGHYNFWKAAVAGAPVTDLYDEYNLSDGNVSGRYSFKGSPYVGDNLKDYRAQSPITYWDKHQDADAAAPRHWGRPRHNHAIVFALSCAERQRGRSEILRLPRRAAISPATPFASWTSTAAGPTGSTNI